MYDIYNLTFKLEEFSNEEDKSAVELALGQDDQGNFYILNVNDEKNPEVVLKTK
jgi:hypothetical protein